MLLNLNTKDWNYQFNTNQQEECITSLESANLLYFPNLKFCLESEENLLLTPAIVDRKAKNISYDLHKDKLSGVHSNCNAEQAFLLRAMLCRFSNMSKHFVQTLFPSYKQSLMIGRTSYRPAEIADRKTSYRKDDRRLHVDAFPSQPNHGKRILRVFSNINPHGQDRIWRLGEPFESVIQQFLPNLPKPKFCYLKLLHSLGITKSLRSTYDHYMLHLHDAMKKDLNYQSYAKQIEVRFPPNSSWIVQTDDVSHAAMNGQYVLEQTFYLPVDVMQRPELSPLHLLLSALKVIPK